MYSLMSGFSLGEKDTCERCEHRGNGFLVSSTRAAITGRPTLPCLGVDSEESFWSGWNAPCSALEAGGP